MELDSPVPEDRAAVQRLGVYLFAQVGENSSKTVQRESQVKAVRQGRAICLFCMALPFPARRGGQESLAANSPVLRAAIAVPAFRSSTLGPHGRNYLPCSGSAALLVL